MRARLQIFLLVSLLGLSASPLFAQVTNCVSGCLGNAVIEVTPDGGKFNKISREPFSGPWTDTLHLQNTGTQSGTWTLDCSQTDGATCSQVSPSVITIAAMEEGTAYLTYTMGASAGNLKLWAWGNSSDSGFRQLVLSQGTAPTVTIVAPVNAAGTAVVHNRQPIIRAYVSGGSSVDSNAFQLTWRGVNRIGSARYSKRLIEWEVDSASWLNPGDTVVASVRACSLGGACNTASISVILENNKPIIGLTGQPLEALGSAYSAPFGPSLSLSGMEVETGFSTIPYFNRSTPRSTGLVYSTRQSYPRAVVAVDLELPPGLGTPDSAKIYLRDAGAVRDSLMVGSPTNCTSYGLHRCRAVLQVDYGAMTFNNPTRKRLTIDVRSKFNGQSEVVVTDSVEVVLVDRRTTMYGSGWWPSALLKLVKDGEDRILIGPTGSATIYRGSGDTSYVAPPGNFTGIRRVGATLELAPRGSTAKLVFDSTTGRLIKSVDANGNRDSIVYDSGTDRILKLVDPINDSIVFHYTGSPKLDGLISYRGSASRAAGVQIDGSNRLVVDSLAQGARSYRTTYIYDSLGNSTYLLTKRIGMLTDTTIVSYDATRKRPTQTRLPQVQDETGATVNPVITYTAFEKQGMGGLRQLDSVYVELKDPRNNWTRSLLNRWRQSVKTWDALGLLGRTQYDGDGFPLWSEGKVADSSRSYNSYDSQHRLVKTYIVRSAGDTLRGDSLVYDSNHRVIRQITNTGQISSVTYDANGNLLTSVTPAGDTTKYFYLYGGMLWKTWAPRAPAPVERIYSATSGYNLWKVVDETGVTDTIRQDSYGRDSLTYQWVIVQAATGAPTTPLRQLRRTNVYYAGDNLVDSTLVLRSNTCTGSCSGGPGFPTPDSLTSVKVVRRYDLAGRDTLRISNHSDTTRYSYDKLSRVRARWPSAGATTVVDSTFYDVAGNVKRVRTRRGFSIVTNFDSRNRDTLTVIDSLGTLRKRYSGPLDQITSVWWSSVIDSIGSVNGSVGYRYDQRGRLLSDTSFAGSAAQVTNYTYDTYERPNTVTDPLGTWTTRYETARGMADTLITAYADTVIYTFDERGRTLGPTIQFGASGLVQTQTLKWNLGQVLDTLTRKVGSTVVSRYLRSAGWSEDGPAVGPTWIDAGGVTWGDSVVYDGLNRVTVRVLRKSGVVAVRDSFNFDPNGNIKTTAGSETYDRHDRLLSRAGSGCTWNYSYDNGGNLTAASCGGTSWSYTYDPLDRLIAARRNGTLIARYGYDVLGRRIVKNVYSSSSGGIVAYTRFVYHGDHVAYETTQNGRITLRYTWGRAADDLLAVRDSSGNHVYTVQDRLRSIRAAYNRGGTWQISLTYGTYGPIVDSTGTLPFELRYRWTGREYDAELGWYYFRSRYYAPVERRFMQEDPAGYGGGQNLYAYVDGGPLEYRDPSGLTKDCGNGGCQDPHDWSGTCFMDHCLGGDGSTYPSGGGTWGERHSIELQGWAAGALWAISDQAHAKWEAMQAQRRQNLQTGDKYLDDPKYRAMIDDNLENAPEDLATYGQGYHVEVGGWCTKTECTRVVGEVGNINIGFAPKGALFAYHLHPNVGMPVLGGSPGQVYAAFPSGFDFDPYKNPTGPRTVNTYIFSSQQIARILVRGGSYSFNPTRDVFNRW